LDFISGSSIYTQLVQTARQLSVAGLLEQAQLTIVDSVQYYTP